MARELCFARWTSLGKYLEQRETCIQWFFFLGKLFLPLCFMSYTDYKFRPLNCNINVAGCKHTQMARHAAKMKYHCAVSQPPPPGLLPSESRSFLPLLTWFSQDLHRQLRFLSTPRQSIFWGFPPRKSHNPFPLNSDLN